MYFITNLVLISLPLLAAAQTECNLEVNPKQDRNADKYFKILNWVKPTLSLQTPTLPTGGTVDLECPNGFLQSELGAHKYTFGCQKGKFNNTYYFRDLLCRSNYHKNDIVEDINPSFIRFEILKCDPPLKTYRVSIRDQSNKYRHAYTVCFDPAVMRPKFAFRPQINTAPKFSFSERENDVWGYDGFGKNTDERFTLSTGYVKITQQNRVTKAFPQQYNQGRTYPYYFNRGHLVPYADFQNEDAKHATCQYINAAPQWEILNEGQWSLVEREARDTLRNNPSEWLIYTGTYGSIPTTRGPLNLAPFFKSDGKFEKSLLPVPMLYWKIVYNVVDKSKSQVYVGVNNPDFKTPATIDAKYKICNPLKDEKTQKTIEGDEYKGFVYKCNLDEFLLKLAAEKIVK